MEGACAQRVLTGQGLQDRTGYKAIREVTGLPGIFLAAGGYSALLSASH